MIKSIIRIWKKEGKSPKPHSTYHPMQTIILTDNKRLSTDYYADKTLFAQKIEVNHILNTEVYQSHISRVRFWTIRTNIHNEQNLVHELCKNLVNRGGSSISFEFSITKIAIGNEAPYMDEKRMVQVNERYIRSSRVLGYCGIPQGKTISFNQFMNMTKPYSHAKTTSSVQWDTTNNQLHPYQQRKTHQRQSSHTPKTPTSPQQTISLKPLFKKQFQVSSLTELSAVFMAKQGIFSQFNLNQQTIMRSKRMITTYIFRQNQIEIGLSVVSEGCKKYIEKAINLEISEAFNIHFNSRKHMYETTCLNENFSVTNMPMSANKLSQEIPKQTYHKILLFLFTHYDPETEKTKVSSSNLSQPNGNNKQAPKSIQAIQEWKMKDQDINIAQKLSKEYVLIKQQVEKQKVSFKNKLKIFQAIIGQSVNVDKLLNQEKQMQTSPNNPNIKPNENTQNSLNTNIPQNSRISRKSELKSMLNSPQQMAVSTNSEFKRLKQSFEMIRNIDNIINEQNKKIQTLKLYQKQILKSKNQMLYKSAKALNQVKKQIKEIKDEIEQKKIQNQFKLQKLQQEKNGKKRNFVPTTEAQDLLESNVKIFKQIIQNEKANKNKQKYLIDDEKNQRNGKQNLQRHSHNCKLDNDPKKSFFIRKQTNSFSHIKNLSSTQQTLQQSFIKQKQSQQTKPNPAPILATLYKSQQQKQTKLMKKRRQQIQNNNIWHSVQQQQNKKSYFEERSEEMSNIKEKQVLIALYEYFLRNNELLREVGKQIGSYIRVDNPRMNKTLKSQLLSNSQVFGGKLRNVHTSFHNNRAPLYASTDQLNIRKYGTFESQNSTMIKNMAKENPQIECHSIEFLKFPLLDDILHPKRPSSATESEDFSIISETIVNHKVQGSQKARQFVEEKKRVTIQNLVKKK